MSEVDIKRKQLIYNSWHRGVREADLIFGPFAAFYVPEFSPLHLSQYEEILEQTDSDLLDWVYNRKQIPDYVNNDVMRMIVQHVHKDEAPTPSILS